MAAPVLVKLRDIAILIAAAVSCLLFILWPFIRDVYVAELTYLMRQRLFCGLGLPVGLRIPTGKIARWFSDLWSVAFSGLGPRPNISG